MKMKISKGAAETMVPMNQKGQFYLIALISITALVIAVILASTQTAMTEKEGPKRILLENARKEMFNAYFAGIAKNDLNSTLSDFSLKLKQFASEHNQELSICFIAFDQNSHYAIGNFSEFDSNFSNNYLSASSNRVDKNSSVVIQKQILLNDYNSSFCGSQFDLRQNFQLLVKLSRGSEQLTYNNLS